MVYWGVLLIVSIDCIHFSLGAHIPLPRGSSDHNNDNDNSSNNNNNNNNNNKKNKNNTKN